MHGQRDCYDFQEVIGNSIGSECPFVAQSGEKFGTTIPSVIDPKRPMSFTLLFVRLCPDYLLSVGRWVGRR